MDKENVVEEVCTERHKNVNDKFARDKERLDKVEEHQAEQDERTQKIETLIVQTSEIIKKHDKELENYGQRIGALESKPGALWDRLVFAMLGALGSGIVVAVLALIFK